MVKTKYSLSILQEYAKNKNGLLLSTEYKSCSDRFIWQCCEGHQWSSCWATMKQHNTWCSICAGNKADSLYALSAYAQSKKGNCLSNIYKNNIEPIMWQCCEGHQWKASWINVKRDGWCPVCSGKQKINLSVRKNFAVSYGGELLSPDSDYVNAFSYLVWKCKEGHIWRSRWNTVKNQGIWCKKCSAYCKTEKIVLSLVEQKLNIIFKKYRFYYDTTNKHRFYEFDGYNEEHKIAFEYHGIQHYIYPNFFHRTNDAFIQQQQRDMNKINYCINNGIRLIIIPYTIKDLEAYIATIELNLEAVDG